MSVGVVLVEDDDLQRAMLERWLAPDTGFQCLGSFRDAKTALTALLRLRPEIIVLDFGLPGMNGAEFLWQAKANWPDMRVLVLTGIPDDAPVFQSLEAGADGFLEKPVGRDQFLHELRELHAGRNPLSQKARQIVLEHLRKFRLQQFETNPLTLREQEILQFLGQGLLNKEIAERLGISPYTVYTHLKHIFLKLNARNRTEAAMKAWRIRGG